MKDTFGCMWPTCGAIGCTNPATHVDGAGVGWCAEEWESEGEQLATGLLDFNPWWCTASIATANKIPGWESAEYGTYPTGRRWDPFGPGLDDCDDGLDDYGSLVDEDDWPPCNEVGVDDCDGTVGVASQRDWREIATTLACALTLVDDTLPHSVRTRTSELLVEVRNG